jgi:3'(2'), 5'-bisphosphate nucleotidase
MNNGENGDNKIHEVLSIAREAGVIIKKYYKGKYEVATKADEFDFVTTADKEADAHIRKRLSELFPNDKLFTEECEDRPTDFSGRMWIVDPLDGTKNFVEKKDDFGTIIGLCVDGKPVLGVVYDPLNDELFYAEKGKGAFAVKNGNTTKIKVSTRSTLAEARLLNKESRSNKARELDPLLDSLPIKEQIPLGVFALKAHMIAQGIGDVSVHPNFKLAKWDTAGTQTIIEEAGGKVTDIHGKPLDYTQKALLWADSAVISNGAVHDELIIFIKDFLDKNPIE